MGLCVPKFKPPQTLLAPTEEDFRKAGTKCAKAADGRCIEYSVFGSSEADARIVINGYYALDEMPYLEPVLLRLNIRYFDISFPGLGLSQIDTGLHHHLWPKTDVEPVLAAEGISEDTKLYVWGQSAGTQYAMAMAQHFGAERVVKLGLRAPYMPKPLSQELMLPVGQPTICSLKDLEPPGTCNGRCLACTMSCSYGIMACWARYCWSCVRPAAAVEDKMGQTKAQMQHKGLMFFKKLMKPHDYQGGLYFMAKEVLLNDAEANQDKGLDVRKLKDNGFVGPDKVLVWWAEDDTDTGPVHPPWLVEHLKAEERKFTKPCGHDGATEWYHEQFLEALVRDGSPAQPSAVDVCLVGKSSKD